MRRVTLGSRRSELARLQSERVARALRERHPGLSVETRWITTEGDRVLDRPLPEIGGKGLFTAELEAALLDGEIDAAVHSLKDLPTDLGPDFEVLGVPEREDPRDVLLTPAGPRMPEDLPRGAVVGTSSLRRRAQLLAVRPDCEVRDVRGNVGTRIEKMRAGEYDALILAAAGLLRLERWSPSGGDALPVPEWLPAPAQGALAVEGRSGDEEVRRLFASLDRPGFRAAVEAERVFLATLEGGCMVPAGALGRAGRGELRLDAAVFSPDGRRSLRTTRSGDPERAAELGRATARDLLDRGAAGLLEAAETGMPAGEGPES